MITDGDAGDDCRKFLGDGYPPPPPHTHTYTHISSTVGCLVESRACDAPVFKVVLSNVVSVS